MGRDRLLPRQLDRISNRFGTPYVSILVGGFVTTVLAGAFYNNIDLSASIVNLENLFTYRFVHLSLMKLRRTELNAKRLFKVPLYPVTPSLGLIVAFF